MNEKRCKNCKHFEPNKMINGAMGFCKADNKKSVSNMDTCKKFETDGEKMVNDIFGGFRFN